MPLQNVIARVLPSAADEAILIEQRDSSPVGLRMTSICHAERSEASKYLV